MIAAPAVDVKGGRCVQLVGGRPDAVAVSLPDPGAAADRWYAAGFRTLHVVDLDAALGSGDNLEVILDVLAATEAETQVGGGIRDDARAQALLEGGADRIVVGTRSIHACSCGRTSPPRMPSSTAARMPQLTSVRPESCGHSESVMKPRAERTSFGRLASRSNVRSWRDESKRSRRWYAARMRPYACSMRMTPSSVPRETTRTDSTCGSRFR